MLPVRHLGLNGNMLDLSFYKNKKVFVTGHTGFKGSWLCRILINSGATVCGYSLDAPTNPNLFELTEIENNIQSNIADIRDFETLKKVFDEFQPEIVLHLAAQPIVRDSYKDPRYTYETNVLGTINLLECIRLNNCVKSFLNVTTDKVYLNNDLYNHPFKEDEPLDGYDPYSNSKSCSELVTHSYNNSFFKEKGIACSTARAGNVIGGGDFANDRIIPDCVRAVIKKEQIKVRNPYSTRPYQHVLEPLMAYLMIAQKQYEDIFYAGYYNIGPDECDCVKTKELVDLFCKYWGEGVTWQDISNNNGPHEANFLKLDTNKIKQTFDWKAKWHIDDCMKNTVSFYKKWMNKDNILEEMNKEIQDYLGD